MIEINQIALQRGGKPLLNNASLRIHDGQRIALIGANGSGKSTLFSILQGQLEIDAGNLSIPAKWRIAHMAQEAEATERSALEYAIDGDKNYRRVETGMQNARNDTELANWIDQMEACKGYEVPSKAERLLDGLGFSTDDLSKSVKDFSGGWRIRLNLAQALMAPSDLLLLDEPTNHLDLEATVWLENWLNNYPGTLLFISHDRDFIDGVANQIVHLDQCSLTAYPGNYSAYEKIKAERLAQQQTLYEKQQTRVKEIEAFVARFRAKATKAKQAQSRLKELQRMELISPAHVDSPFQFSFPCAEQTSSPLLTLDNANLGYAEPVLENTRLSIHPGDRVAILGSNGSGKSTLLKSLCLEIPVLEGQRIQGEHLKLGYYAQHQLESLDPASTPADTIQALRPEASTQEIRNFLGSFGFHGDRAFETIGPFSGGEKARLALATIAWLKPNLLILDEPTNHLDIEMREALAFALQTFGGAILLVSHDRHLIKSTVDSFWMVSKGSVSEFEGTLEEYYQLHNQDKQAQSENIQPDSPSTSSSNSRKEQKRKEAEARKARAPITNAIKKLETRLEKEQKSLSEVEAKLAENDIYSDERKNELKELLERQQKLSQLIESMEEEWMELSEKLED